MLAAIGGCRRPTGCPKGTVPVPGRATDVAVWCRAVDGSRTLWVELYPGTKQGRQGCPFTDKTLEGTYESWHASGKPRVTGHYRNGRHEGRWLQVDEKGERVGFGVYRDGKLVEGVPVAVSATCANVTPL
jgi:hypothetical protein